MLLTAAAAALARDQRGTNMVSPLPSSHRRIPASLTSESLSSRRLPWGRTPWMCPPETQKRGLGGKRCQADGHIGDTGAPGQTEAPSAMRDPRTLTFTGDPDVIRLPTAHPSAWLRQGHVA